MFEHSDEERSAAREVRLLLISGSTRGASTNTAALRTILASVPAGVSASMYDGLAALPAFNPDDDQEAPPAPVVELRKQITEADAVLFCTPEYAGSLPGSFKNLLDWTVGGPGIYGKPVAWINVAAEGRGGGADATLATVLRYVGSERLQGAGTRIPVARQAVGPDGLIADAELRDRLVEFVRGITEEVRNRPEVEE